MLDNVLKLNSDFVCVNFIVLDENDNSFIFVNVVNFIIVENFVLGINVGLVFVIDFDVGSND